MSNKNISYLQTLCGISDDYTEHLETLTGDELHAEHEEVFGEDSPNRMSAMQSMFDRLLSAKKREIASKLTSDAQERKSNCEVLELVKKKYGTLKEFLIEGFLNDSSMPPKLTLQYRNMEEVTEEDIELLVEFLHERGKLKIEDD